MKDYLLRNWNDHRSIILLLLATMIILITTWVIFSHMIRKVDLQAPSLGIVLKFFMA